MSVRMKGRKCSVAEISVFPTGISGALHMIPVDRAVSITEMKLVSVHMAGYGDFQPAFRDKKIEKVLV